MTNVTSTRGLDVDRAQDEPSSGELGWGFSSLRLSLSFPLIITSLGNQVQLRKRKQDGGAAGHSGVGLQGTRCRGPGSSFYLQEPSQFPTCRMG